MDNINVTIQIIVGLTVILPIISGFVVFLVKKWNKVNKLLNRIDAELKPNHGTSICDRLTRIETRLIISDQRTKLLFSVYDDGLYECNKYGSCTWVNKRLKEIFGLDEQDMIDNGWLVAIIPDMRNKVFEYWHYCVKNNIPYEVRYIVYNKTEDIYYKIETFAIPQKDHENNVIGYFGILKVLEKNEKNIFTV